MDKNFKVRTVVGVSIFIVSVIALYVLNGIPFKILIGASTLVAIIELFSFFRKKTNELNIFLAILEIVFLIWGAIFIANIDVDHFWYVVLGVPGYDVFAYLFGKAFGGKIFKKTRPFPRISKNKTWEGTISGLAMAVGMVAILIAVRGSFDADWIYLFCGPLALIGDLYESFLKRKFGVKDSNEILIKNKFFEKIELIVGGSEGHGGFLDRIDSVAFTATILLIVSSLL